MSSIYRDLSIEELEELQSRFLISNWSYSKVQSFARNEKAFEMNYIFGIYSRSSATTMAGKAYHHALQYFFTQFKEGKILDVVELEQSAFAYLEEVDANKWKIQKTTPTIEDCIKKATTTVAALLRNFRSEINTYIEDIKDILDVELRIDAFLTVNGVDIPMPCSMAIDLVVRTKEDKIAIIDHKSKNAYTDEEELALAIGSQAITYVLGYEEFTGVAVDEVWFVENKYSKNKDNPSQLSCYKVSLDVNTRRLYEALLYEPLKRMVEAVSDPDYVYLINPSDNFSDKSELYDFWARTMICEVDDFNVEESKKELVAKRLRKIRDSSLKTVPVSAIQKFKANAASFITYDLSNKDMTHSEKIEHVLKPFGISVQVAHQFDGYSSNTYLLEKSAGVAFNSLYSKRLDIANALDVSNVRISKELIMHNNKSYLAIEHSKKREKNLMFDPAEVNEFKLPVGKDNFNNTVVWDLQNHSTPHLLVCGATGSGKSIFIKSTINYALEAGIQNIIVCDPKFSSDLKFSQMPTFNEIHEIEEVFEMLVAHMEKLIRSNQKELTLVVLDEFADALDNSRTKKQVGEAKTLEENLKLLAQKGRSCGIRLVIGTQRASTKVIKGDIKVNFPVQVCFRVPKEIDSKVVLDESGAESLAGQGDGLIKSPEYDNCTVRFQAFYKP